MQPPDFTGILVIIAIVAIAAGVLLYFRRHPDAKAKLEPVLGEVKQDAESVVGRIVDTLHNLTAAHATAVQTNAAQAAVIASPPVQAVINAASAAVPTFPAGTTVTIVGGGGGGGGSSPAPVAHQASPTPATAPTSTPNAAGAAALAMTGSGDGPAPAVAAPASALTPRIDAVVPTGSPDTETLPVTGHVLSLPEAGESLMSYMRRVSVQAGAADKVNSIGLLFTSGVALPAVAEAWPSFTDRYYNARAYMTDAERAAFDAEQAAWSNYMHPAA